MVRTRSLESTRLSRFYRRVGPSAGSRRCRHGDAPDGHGVRPARFFGLAAAGCYTEGHRESRRLVREARGASPRRRRRRGRARRAVRPAQLRGRARGRRVPLPACCTARGSSPGPATWRATTGAGSTSWPRRSPTRVSGRSSRPGRLRRDAAPAPGSPRSSPGCVPGRSSASRTSPRSTARSRRAGWVSIHGPVVTQLGGQPREVVERLFRLLESPGEPPPFPHRHPAGRGRRRGSPRRREPLGPHATARDAVPAAARRRGALARGRRRAALPPRPHVDPPGARGRLRPRRGASALGEFTDCEEPGGDHGSAEVLARAGGGDGAALRRRAADRPRRR